MRLSLTDRLDARDGIARRCLACCAQGAVELSETAKRALKNLTDPTGIDNDLQDLKDDPDLKRIID
ncbi:MULTISPECIES: hypothetical protein [Rhizobium]|uniref:hypothetical protein n=1 Tax=Rhizobium TaxID=379 RepID=UPI000410E7A6|nr:MULTISPECIES: hypothetical protein [Rhizobium]MCA0802150.1 hypothetical protein [Rhizobium sp. T1473]MCS0458778.1 hypothetical protein [Rhizobium favelukesii]UFS80704.1 hypothetical protein LPB79_20260 [Rhizobium sp. T136]